MLFCMGQITGGCESDFTVQSYVIAYWLQFSVDIYNEVFNFIKIAGFMALFLLSKFFKQSTLEHFKFTRLIINYLKENSRSTLWTISNLNN